MNPTPSDMVAEIAVQKAAAAKNGTLFADTRTSKSGRRVQGYASVFYNPSDPDGTSFMLFPDVQERIAPTAFYSALKRKDDAVLNLNHDNNFTLARVGAGTLTLAVDSIGLKYEAELRDDATSEYVLAAVKRQDIAGASFQFKILSDSFTENPDGLIVRTVEDVELLDCAICTRGAYNAASAYARSVSPTGRTLHRNYCFRTKDDLTREIEQSEARYFNQQRNILSAREADRIDLSLNVLLRLRKKHNL